MDEEKWYTLTQAGLSVGRSRYYFRKILENHPEYFDGVLLKEVSHAKIIRESDIPKVVQHVKKGEDRRRNLLLTTVKAKNSFAFFFPFYSLN